MADNNFKGTVEALFRGMDGVITSKTVVGDAIHINDTIILPLVDVSFAVGAGAFNADQKEKDHKQMLIPVIVDGILKFHLLPLPFLPECSGRRSW